VIGVNDYGAGDPGDWDTPDWAPPLDKPAGTVAGPTEYGDDLEAAITDMADEGEPFLVVAPEYADPLLVSVADLSPVTGPRLLATFEQIWPQMPDDIGVNVVLVDPDAERVAEFESNGWPLTSDQAEAIAEACIEISDGLLLYRSRLVWRGFNVERSVSIDPSYGSGSLHCAAGLSVNGAGSAGSAVIVTARHGHKVRDWQIAVPHAAAAAVAGLAGLAVVSRRVSRRRRRRQR